MRKLGGWFLAMWALLAPAPVMAQPLAQRCPDPSQMEPCVQRVMHESERALAAAMSRRPGGPQGQWISQTHDSCARLAATSPADLFDVTFAECVINAFDARLSELARAP